MSGLQGRIGVLLLCMLAVGCEGWQWSGTAPAVDSTAVDTLTVQPDSALVDSVLVPGHDTPSSFTSDTLSEAALLERLEALQGQVQAVLGAHQQTQAKLDSLLIRADSAGVAAADSAEAQSRREQLQQGLRSFGTNVILALIVIAIIYFIIRAVVGLLETLSERNAKRRLFFKKLIPIFRLTAWCVSIYFIVVIVFQVGEDRLLAASAAVGVAIGFASQDILKNVFGGILILLDQPFQTGDKINVGGTYGEVVSVGLRSTRIVTPDDNLVSVPNAQVVEGQVSNANAGALDCQVVTPLYLPGWIDVMEAKTIAYHAAANSKYVYLKKPIVVLVQDMFEDMFLTKLLVKAYVIDTRYEGPFASDVTEAAKAEFQKRGWIPAVTTMHPLDQVFGVGHAPEDDNG